MKRWESEARNRYMILLLIDSCKANAEDSTISLNINVAESQGINSFCNFDSAAVIIFHYLTLIESPLLPVRVSSLPLDCGWLGAESAFHHPLSSLLL